MKRKIFSKIILSLSFLLLFSVFSSGQIFAKNEEAESLHLQSVESYIKYLENYKEKEAVNLGVEKSEVSLAVKESKKILEQFKSLGKEDQKLFLEYMRDPELIKKTLSGEDPNLKMIPTEDIKDDREKQQVLAASRTVSHSGELTALGITWTEYKIEGEYEYNSLGATRAITTRAWVSKSYNPTITTIKEDSDGYVRNGIYDGWAIFSYKIGVAGYGAQIGTFHLGVSGNHRGKVNGYFYRE